MARSRRQDRRSVMTTLDGLLFGFAAVSAVWLAYLLLAESFRPNWQIMLLLVFWLLVAYLVLPRIHSILTHLYLPGYFIGRARTGAGLLSDPVNVALLGSEEQVHAAMTTAGWTRADEVSFGSALRIASTTLTRKSYPEAPVSPLQLFDRQQDFAYQQEVAGNPAKRHHVRFWRCPEGWMLPGGHSVDWVAAGTFDRSVGMSLLTFQITHRIAPDIDEERDHIVATLIAANPDVQVELIKNFSTGYHTRNGGGDAIRTDGDLPVVDLRSIPVPVAEPAPAPAVPSRVRRPAPTVFGSVFAWLRGTFNLLIGLLLLLVASLAPDLPSDPRLAVTVLGAVFLAIGVADVGLGLATFLGHNWARVLLMLTCVLTIVGAFAAEVGGGPRPTLAAGLPTVALGVLVLLALSSRPARHYAMNRRRSSR